CDQYHRYKEDIALMAELGFTSYRFSLAWTRILPDGTGKVNPEGIAYYRNVCEELHKYNMSACATLYHWDLPQILEDKGGWANRSVLIAFEEYAKACYESLGDLVDMWITINEPYCIAYLGHFLGQHAPGHNDLQKAIAAIHHVNMAHGIAVREYRKTKLKAPIGITWNTEVPRPATVKPEDKKAADVARAVNAEVFVFPCLNKGYPERVIKELGFAFPIENGDMETIAQPIDFIGINNYFEHAVAADENAPFTFSNKPFWQQSTEMGWPITPAGFERQIEWIADISRSVTFSDGSTKSNMPIYITENGVACDDVVSSDGRVHDKNRISYFQQYLPICAKLIQKGIPLKGYFAWSLLDNFEWAWGYTKRFGLIHVDFATLKRTPKDSAYFMRDVIAGFGEW
ncbi:MAG: family 1 glycosylhydrolase, partial [Treponema sp.]|nr:family 1 glycosylhydrolase [Treponema sp.]